MQCPKCVTAPRLREGKPLKDGENVYIVQIYKCNDPRCENYDKDIGEVRTDLFDNANQTEVYY